MRIILTHDQADFDAVASMLGALLLDPGAIALLPRAINRNAREFINTYKSDLGYTNSHKLPSEPVEHITLVDTQSLITLKGMSGTTLVQVIDHHPRKQGVDASWQVEITHTGACTTLLVEKIKEKSLPVSTIQATMLLLGIYEDTGSLSYSSTSARDLCAAGYLLDQGADLQKVAEFLNPPLTASQQVLYDRIMQTLETHLVQNQTIITAMANATDINDEISSVAHKLRDFLDPEALLLMVLTKQGIRLVARATTDAVNVSRIAAHFGGGGHARASSALIRPEGKLSPEEFQRLLEKTYLEMISILDKHVKPLITVRHIMSKNPLILTPDTPVDEVARLMRRYGFEGYPVVVNGTIVGLLTRRNVDRALTHQLSVPASSLMDAGNIFVYPDDSMETLEKVMISSGWGQIPVIDPQNGEVVGIVTRTDLIKSRSSEKATPSQEAIIQKLKKAVPASRYVLLKIIAQKAESLNLPIFIVGGFVRDLLLGRKSLDFDIVVEGDAIFFMKMLVKSFGGRSVSHNRFGTAKWYLADDKHQIAQKLSDSTVIDPNELPEHLDFITARTEFYTHPAALPIVESSGIKMDLHRRDFTINTLALRLDGDNFGKIFDFWGGLDDLRDKKIRILHALSFVDDATRLLRAVRFEQRFGFVIEERTLALMADSLPLISEMTGIRLLHEIELIISEAYAIKMFRRLDGLNILNAIYPALTWDTKIENRFTSLNHMEDPLPWQIISPIGQLTLRQALGMIYLLMDKKIAELDAIAERLKVKRPLIEAVRQVNKLVAELDTLAIKPPSQIAQRLSKISHLAIFTAYTILQSEAQKELLRKYINDWSNVKPFTDGNDLLALGLPASPKLGTILDALRAAWLDGDIHSEAQEKELLAALIKQKE